MNSTIKKIVFILWLLFSLSLSYNCKEDKNTSTPPFPIEQDLQLLSILPESINESSGLIYYNDQLWTHNDGVGDNRLYQISPNSPVIEESIILQNSTNIDWEDIAQDESHLYIGDFGNNAGDRQNLKIYKIPKNNFTENTDTIFFSFADQLNFTGPLNQHNFDCEAMIVDRDSIYLFSKNHLDQQTRLYQIPKIAGQYQATVKARFDTKGLITAADLDQESNTLCLLGFEINNDRYLPFVWIFYDYPNTDFFRGKNKRVDLAIEAQTEGIAHQRDGLFFISSENENDTQGNLFLFDAEKWK